MSKMCRKEMLRTMTASLLIALMLIVVSTPQAMAAGGGTKKMTVYSNVIKKGSTVYCVTHTGLYKAKVKNKKVVSKKCLVELTNGGTDMKIKGKYLYYKYNYAVGAMLYRVNLKTGKNQSIFAPHAGRFKNCDEVYVDSYVIKGNKLYAKITYGSLYGKSYTKTFVSKLNGKSLKVSKVKISNKTKTTNAKGYKTAEKSPDDDFLVKSYLKTPKGKYYLGKGYLY